MKQKKFIERTETVLITEGMVASICIAVMIKQVTKQKITTTIRV